MTGQIPDEIMLNDENFSLVGVQGQNLPTPEKFGVAPYSSCTACWRGYVMRYILKNDQLFLNEMDINADDPPKLNGVEPQKGNRLFKYNYQNLNIKTNFTGNLLLAKDFIDSMYIHMGFQRPLAFQTIVEINLKEGNVISVKDLSKKLERLRNEDPYKDAQPNSRSHKDTRDWIERAFSLDYDF
ncbi:MAG: hypothetical protein ACW98X_00570 [Promethearchaeota archaeon]|jgi:hypothetical protein